MNGYLLPRRGADPIVWVVWASAWILCCVALFAARELTHKSDVPDIDVAPFGVAAPAPTLPTVPPVLDVGPVATVPTVPTVPTTSGPVAVPVESTTVATVTVAPVTTVVPAETVPVPTVPVETVSTSTTVTVEAAPVVESVPTVEAPTGPYCSAEDEIGCVFRDQYDDSDPALGIVDTMATWWTCVIHYVDGAVAYQFRDTDGRMWIDSTTDLSLVVADPLACPVV